jgi:beta-glucosidase
VTSSRCVRFCLALGLALSVVLVARGTAQQALPPYKDVARPVAERVADLLSRLTLEEKVSQLVNAAEAVPRLDIPAYNWWNEALHGVARAGHATVFPQAIGLAATWDEPLMQQVATTISTQARAKYNVASSRNRRGLYDGLTFWSPNINIFRDPRWGRGMETYGEDPYLSGRLAVAFVRGMQGDDPRYLKTVATPKHYAVHSGPEPERHTFDVTVSEIDLRDTYLPQFEMAVREGGALSVMCAYNRVAGESACASPRLLTDILRKEWGFDGYVVSDCDSIWDIYQTHKMVPSAEEASAMGVKAGCDLNCGDTYKALVEAVKKGLLKEADIDEAVRRLFTIRFRLGMFDPPSSLPWASLGAADVERSQDVALAERTAAESLVLLKNDGNLLPLRRDLRTIAVIGPNADEVEVLLGNYNGTPRAPVTILEGIRRAVRPGTRVLTGPRASRRSTPFHPAPSR